MIKKSGNLIVAAVVASPFIGVIAWTAIQALVLLGYVVEPGSRTAGWAFATGGAFTLLACTVLYLMWAIVWATNVASWFRGWRFGVCSCEGEHTCGAPEAQVRPASRSALISLLSKGRVMASRRQVDGTMFFASLSYPFNVEELNRCGDGSYVVEVSHPNIPTPERIAVTVKCDKKIGDAVEVPVDAKCPVCHALLLDGGALTFCAKCSLPHHTECANGGKCAAFACGTEIPKMIKQEELDKVAKERDEWKGRAMALEAPHANKHGRGIRDDIPFLAIGGYDGVQYTVPVVKRTRIEATILAKAGVMQETLFDSEWAACGFWPFFPAVINTVCRDWPRNDQAGVCVVGVYVSCLNRNGECLRSDPLYLSGSVEFAVDGGNSVIKHFTRSEVESSLVDGVGIGFAPEEKEPLRNAAIIAKDDRIRINLVDSKWVPSKDTVLTCGVVVYVFGSPLP